MKQKATIRLLTEQLQEQDSGRKSSETSVSGSDLFTEFGNRKSLAVQLSREKQERMKVMKEYTSVQQKFKEVLNFVGFPVYLVSNILLLSVLV